MICYQQQHMTYIKLLLVILLLIWVCSEILQKKCWSQLGLVLFCFGFVLLFWALCCSFVNCFVFSILSDFYLRFTLFWVLWDIKTRWTWVFWWRFRLSFKEIEVQPGKTQNWLAPKSHQLIKLFLYKHDFSKIVSVLRY